ncbi:MAG: retroviral-like aspartic protease, partial [Victivallales bacterium]|nr:retroviral-like aspartic protease [Victivallales bacterium]
MNSIPTPTPIDSVSTKKRPTIIINLFGEKIDVLFDTGASISAMDYRLFSRLLGPLKFKPLHMNRSLTIRGISKQQLTVKGLYEITFKLLDQEFSHGFYIIKGMANAMICGADFINTYGIIIDGGRRKI